MGEQPDKQTRLAEQRTLLEHERTLAAWIRTGLATVALGLAAAELLETAQSDRLVQVIGATLIAAGGVVLVLAYRSYRRPIQELEARGVPGIAPRALAAFVFVLVLASVAALVLVLS